MKRRAVETMEGTAQVINHGIQNLSQAGQGQHSALRKTIRRVRVQAAAAPPSPVDLQTLQIPQVYTQYTAAADRQPEQFLLADSGPGNNRILIFGREVNLDLLQTSQNWFMDGTFRTSTVLFSQVFCILAERFGGVHPAIYALLPNKQRATYSRLFEMLLQIRPNLRPTAITSDLELAIVQAATEAFQGVQINGCLFHLSRNMKKKIGQLVCKVYLK